jgi:hydroxymethylpyrimidine/phosphomethylpyrimidine kinase
MLNPPKILTFSATDPTGGAGMSADIMTQSSLGCHPLSVVTGITVQDTMGVESLMPVAGELVNEQARNILEDSEVNIIKCGVLSSAENIAYVAEIISDYPDIPVIIDPILASGRGDELANEEMRQSMIQLLFPHATLITPNSYEARRLVLFDDEDIDQLTLEESATRLIAAGCDNVLITGAHEKTKEVINTLYQYENSKDAKTYHWERLPGGYHGSGCTLTSAIAAYLAHGLNFLTAVEEGQHFTWQALKHAYRSGMGQLTPDRFFWMDEEEEDGRFTHH